MRLRSIRRHFAFPTITTRAWSTNEADCSMIFQADRLASIDQFGTVLEFTLSGMDRDTVQRQWIESPSTPIVHTLIERPTVSFELVTFATDRPGEGRVDNVLLEVRANHGALEVAPRLNVQCAGTCGLDPGDSPYPVLTRSDGKPWIYCMSSNPRKQEAVMWARTGGYELYLEHLTSSPQQPARYLFRIPQDDATATVNTTYDPDALLMAARQFWQDWKPFGGRVQFVLSGTNSDFLAGCARNIQQARENKDGQTCLPGWPYGLSRPLDR